MEGLDGIIMKKGTTAPLRFVLLEDDPNDAELIQLQLAKDGIEVDWRHVVAERDFREALAGAPPDRRPSTTAQQKATESRFVHHRYSSAASRTPRRDRRGNCPGPL